MQITRTKTALVFLAAILFLGAAVRFTTDQMNFLAPFTGAVARLLTTHLADMPVNVKVVGAKCDGTTDDAAAFQRAITAASPGGSGREVRVPNGSCVIGSTLNINLIAGLRFRGAGYSSILLWKGSAAGPMFYVSSSREIIISDLRLQPFSAAFPIASMIVQEQLTPTTSASTMNTYKNLQIPGLGVMTQGIYVKGDVNDANNDFNNFLSLFINGYTEAGIIIQGANSFSNRIVNTQLGGGLVGHYGIKALTGAGGESGHFAVYGGATLGHTTADIYIQANSSFPYVIDNLYSESSVAFIVEDGAIGTRNSTIIRGVKFSTSNAGVGPIITIKNPGPVRIENSFFGTDFTKAATISWTYVAGFSPPSFQVVNSRIRGTLNTMNTIFTSTRPTIITDTYWATSTTVSGLLTLNPIVPVTYASGSATSLGSPDLSTFQSPVFATTATNNLQFGWGNPVNPSAGQIVRFQVKNNSGGLLNAANPFQGGQFRASAWTPPANTKNNTTTFMWDANGSVYYEIGRTADTPN